MKVVREFQAFFKLDIMWAVCGGDAIDLFIGTQTRDHKDLDIAVFWEDREKIIDFMLKNNWRVFEPDDGKLREITNLSNDYRRNDNLWCLSKDNKTYDVTSLGNHYYEIESESKNQDSLDFIEFLFNKVEQNQFLYKRNVNIKMALENAILIKDTIPILAPEFVLLYKSIFIRFLNSDNEEIIDMIKNYRHDFDVILEKLSVDQINWLFDALLLSYPNGHEWIELLKNYN